jgi:integrase
MEVHVLPYFGRRRIQDITTADVADFVVYLRPRLKGSTAAVLVGVLGQVFSYAVRRGLIASNPVRSLERKERPKKGRREKRILEPQELTRLLEHASESNRLLFETIAWTGLRVSEALGVRWKDLDLRGGFVIPKQQFRRAGGPAVELKSQAGTGRSIVLAPQLASKLKAHRLVSPWSQDDDLVFGNARGKPRGARGVLDALDLAAGKAGLNGGDRRKLTTHDLRHHFASVLIASGADVVHVSRQLGHASVAMTLDVYADEYAKVAHADKSREALSAAMERATFV